MKESLIPLAGFACSVFLVADIKAWDYKRRLNLTKGSLTILQIKMRLPLAPHNKKSLPECAMA
jgi:hypothetical protein